MTDSILYAREARSRVTFNRPASLNAMGFEMGRRWRDIAHEIASDDTVGAVLMDAAGPAFCAGGDVIEMSTSGASGADVTEMAGIIHDGIRTFVEADKPSSPRCRAPLPAAASGLMLTADYIVASPSAKFVSRYANIGLSPDLGVSTLLPRRSGRPARCDCCCRTRRSTPRPRSTGARDRGRRRPRRPRGRGRAFWLENATAAFGQAKRLIRAVRAAPSPRTSPTSATIGARFDTPTRPRAWPRSPGIPQELTA
jgi:2-(1,2-epoxy-1,2-dihydrophenyl)acetyl-CoA isomerase